MLETIDKMKMSQVLDLLSTPAEAMTGPELRRCRELMGLSVLEVSNATGIPPLMLHAIEMVDHQTPKQLRPKSHHAMIITLAKLYRIPIQRPTLPWETPNSAARWSSSRQ
ncbi:MAG: helix-turn-helix domain-containing protein [Phycisphaeraceae bacterium]